MGSTNFTPHYDIPLPLGSDKTTPMDYNPSMQAIDTALFEAEGNASDAKQSVTTLTQDLAQTNDDVSALAGRVTTAEGTITSQGNAITNLGTRIDGVKADAQDMICAYNEATATASRNYAIGDYFIYNDVLYRATQAINSGNTIVPDTNCTTTNVTSEIKNFNPDLSAYQTKQDNALNTSSKLVVGAINELNNKLPEKVYKTSEIVSTSTAVQTNVFFQTTHSVNVPTGYTIAGAFFKYLNSNYIVLTCAPDNVTNNIRVMGIPQTDFSLSYKITVLFEKSV